MLIFPFTLVGAHYYHQLYVISFQHRVRLICQDDLGPCRYRPAKATAM